MQGPRRDVTGVDSATDGGRGIADVAAEGRRRRLLRVLADADEDRDVTLAGAARTLVASGAADADEPVAASRGRELYLELYREDVPALRRAGLVEYDEETGLLALTAPEAAIDEALPDDGG